MPAPPPGFGYVPDDVHGFVLVPLASASAPPRQAVARPHVPHPATGYGQPPGEPVRHPGGQVLSFPVRSSQLVRGLIDKDGVARDPWAETLADVPDMAPVGAPPTDDEMERVHMEAMSMRPAPASEVTQAHDDPAQDAFGGHGLTSTRITTAVGPSGG